MIRFFRLWLLDCWQDWVDQRAAMARGQIYDGQQALAECERVYQVIAQRRRNIRYPVRRRRWHAR